MPEAVWSLVNAATTRAGITPDESRVAIKSGSTVGFSLADPVRQQRRGRQRRRDRLPVGHPLRP
jgi:hypothetical protein